MFIKERDILSKRVCKCSGKRRLKNLPNMRNEERSVKTEDESLQKNGKIITKNGKQSVCAVPLAARRVLFLCIQVRHFCHGGCGGGTSSARNVITAEKRSCLCVERLKRGIRSIRDEKKSYNL